MKCPCCFTEVESVATCKSCKAAECSEWKRAVNTNLETAPFDTKHLKGRAASPGLAVGPPVWAFGFGLSSWHDLVGTIKDGDILIASMTTPDIIPAMPKIAGIVTLEGGITSHASLIAREFGIPAVVGIGTEFRYNSDMGLANIVTVDGNAGEVILEKRDEGA